MPPRRSRVSTTRARPPSSPTARAAVRPAGPPPMISTVSLGIGVVPGEELGLPAAQPVEVALELRPRLLPVDAHLLEQRPVVGAVPVELADPVGVGARRPGREP